ncbi:MAG: NUDIX hydrolase [Oligoflexales bacterium]
MIEGKIRIITLGIVRNEQEEILFDAMKDPNKNLDFLRPIGGGVEFSESCENAIAREFEEEIGAEVTDTKLIKIFENIFQYNGKLGHEIVFFFEVVLAGNKFYELKEILVKEGSENRVARWYSKSDLEKTVILPPQIVKYL